MKKLLLLDGLSIANRAFYGIPILTNKEGLYTNAIYGFLNIMFSLIEKEKPDLVGVAFDVSAPTFRHQKVSDYKGTRKGMPEELRPQIPLLKEVLQAMAIHMMEKPGFEADDLLGTLAKAGEKEGFQVVIVSGDRDLLQITSENIELKIPKTKQTGTEIESYYSKDVIEKYGVTPIEFIDVKGLMGDTSDNIKGVPGVGEKTAIKLIQEYHSMEELYEKVEHIKQNKLRENLMAYKEQALESKMLATIVCDVELVYKWEAFEYKLTLTDETYDLFRRLEFKKLLTRFKRETSEKKEEEVFELTEHQTLEIFSKETKKVALTYFCEKNAIGLGLSNGQEVAYLEYDLNKAEDLNCIKAYFEDEEIYKIIHDSKQLRHDLASWNIALKGEIFDTFIGAYLLHPTNSTYDIAEIGELLLDKGHMDTLEVFLGKGKSAKTFTSLEYQQRSDFLAQRAYYLYTIYEKMSEALKDEHMENLFEQIEMPLCEVLFDMEQEGITIDPVKLRAYGDELQILIDAVEKIIYDYAGEVFNINSPKQLGVILFEKMAIPPVKKTKTGYSTAAEVLETLKERYPIVEKILEYRQYVKLKSTYVEGLLQVMTSENKIHSTFNQTITATGRISSTEPNLQNIPIKMELGRKIRKVFIPKNTDYIFLDADYSQIELRVLASIAKDETMIHAFKNNVDIHALTASQVLHIPIEEVSLAQRSNAKAVNFGIVYGISAFALSEDLKISQKEAQKYIEGYFEKYPKVKIYLDDVIKEATKQGYVLTLYNRKRDIPELSAKNHNIREFGKRVAMNTPIQGAAADMIKMAMIRVHNALKERALKSRLILTVHDELLLEVYKPELEEVSKLLKIEMEEAAQLEVPLEVDIHSGASWFEAK